MGSHVGNIRLAGDAAARQRAAASEGIQMRRAAMQNRMPTGGGGGGDPGLPPGPQANPSQPQIGPPPGNEQGSPAYQQMMEGIRGLRNGRPGL